MTYEPRWDIDRARGIEAEQLVRNMRSALAVGSAEVKRDDRAAETGNLYLEYECQRAGGWAPSGIKVTEATNWVWVMYDMRVIVWMPTWLMRNIGRRAWLNGQGTACPNGSHPTRGVLIPVDSLLSEARLAAKKDPNAA